MERKETTEAAGCLGGCKNVGIMECRGSERGTNVVTGT